MSLQTRIQDLATRIATEFKTVKTIISGTASGSLTGLTTTIKTNIVAAINELKTEVGGKEPTIVKKTAFNNDYGTTAGTVVQGNDTRVVEAFAKKVNAISITGDTNKTITVTREDGSILTASFLDNNDPQFPDDVINTLTFNANNDGALVAVTSLGEILSVSLDGRYSLIGHTHAISDITGLTAELASKANASDVYTKTEIGNPETDLVSVFEANLI